jgi:hypothetical protein
MIIELSEILDQFPFCGIGVYTKISPRNLTVTFNAIDETHEIVLPKFGAIF